jgi:hypothetical protein
MTQLFLSETPWSLVEWFATGLTTVAVSIVAFVWRVMSRLDRMSIAVDRQRVDFGIHKQESESSFAKLSDRLDQTHDEYYRLRETMGALPNRGDLRDLQDHIGERIEALAARFDRALETRAF